LIVVSDTSPLNYLVQIDAIGILAQLHERVVIPESVLQELIHPQTPEKVIIWARSLPEWVSVRKPQTVLSLGLDAGEQEAISLALELTGVIVLMDERKGRRVASGLGLSVSGTVAQIGQAAQSGFLDFNVAAQRLAETNFRDVAKVIAAVRLSLGLSE
jgi:predicted nucleic acid-binding protein